MRILRSGSGPAENGIIIDREEREVSYLPWIEPFWLNIEVGDPR